MPHATSTVSQAGKKIIWNRNSERTNRTMGKSEEKRGLLRGVFSILRDRWKKWR
jgi:hypothetical protein